MKVEISISITVSIAQAAAGRARDIPMTELPDGSFRHEARRERECHGEPCQELVFTGFGMRPCRNTAMKGLPWCTSHLRAHGGHLWLADYSTEELPFPRYCRKCGARRTNTNGREICSLAEERTVRKQLGPKRNMRTIAAQSNA